MAYDLEEQEKFDAMKAWWATWGNFVVNLAIAAMLVWGGWWSWKAYQSHRANQAMGYFEALQDASHQSGPDAIVRIKAAANTLRSDYPNTGYASRGVLVAASALIAQNDPVSAREQLEWLAGKAGDPALQPVANLRLAGLLLDQKQYDPALSHLQNPPAAFAALFADRRGDVLAAQGKKEEALAAWRQALNELGTANPLRQVVQLKFDALSGA